MKFSDFLTFNKFLTPYLVNVIYWIGLIGIIIASLVMFFSAFSAFGGFKNIIGAVVLLAVGTLFWRVVCEGLILSFKVLDRLTEIRDRLPR